MAENITNSQRALNTVETTNEGSKDGATSESILIADVETFEIKYKELEALLFTPPWIYCKECDTTIEDDLSDHTRSLIGNIKVMQIVKRGNLKCFFIYDKLIMNNEVNESNEGTK